MRTHLAFAEDSRLTSNTILAETSQVPYLGSALRVLAFLAERGRAVFPHPARFPQSPPRGSPSGAP
eukprot:2524638-Pyramimonas_sp.AAC.1